MCSRRHLLLEHIAMGYYPYSELAAAPAVKIPTASIGFCLKSVSERGPFDIHYARIYVDGVEVSHPELYNDGRYVVHGLHGFLRPLSRTSCVDGSHHHPRSSAICKAIDRLHDGGYGFMALAMHANLGVLERLANLTVFALDDQAIFVGGGRDYIYTARFHLVPGHRLTCAELLRLQAGKLLPTLAGKGQSLAVNILGGGSSTDDVRINYIPIKEADVVINSRIAVHGVYMPFPHIHHASAAHSYNCRCGSDGVQMKVVATSKSPQRARSAWGVSATVAAAAVSFGLVGAYCLATEKKRRTPLGTRPKCALCREEGEKWVMSCCSVGLCSMCLEEGILKWHFKNHQKTPYLWWMRREHVACRKKREGRLINVGEVEYYGIDKAYIMTKDCPLVVNEGESTFKVYTRLQDLEDLLHLHHVRYEDWPRKIKAQYFKKGGELVWVRSYDLPVSPRPQALYD